MFAGWCSTIDDCTDACNYGCFLPFNRAPDVARSVGVDRAMTFTARTNAFGDPLPAAQRSAFGSECQLFWKPGGCGGTDAGRCGVTENGELYAWYLDAAAWCEDSNPLCQFAMGAPVRTGCSRAERAGYFVECCVHAEGMDGAVDCVDTIIDR